ncbi:hypothetical protein KUL72_19905 [Bradyrhizobium arachidis]|uniref:hypothetical protein n=1 Tax=Bradyrhizobium arachidis TaxID=858423 RepID=UPI0021614375|nr:hypothetical protein [Bradyrhizobium arachidis]UVO33789.1 hypothetical protein KUL72_19905 [Bradyrhizobium arachidis]
MQVNLTANGASTPVPWSGGFGTVAAWGTFGGGTVTLQMSPDNGNTWINVDRSSDTYVTFTANGQGDFQLGLCLLRFNLTGATAPSVWVSL